MIVVVVVVVVMPAWTIGKRWEKTEEWSETYQQYSFRAVSLRMSAMSELCVCLSSAQLYVDVPILVPLPRHPARKEQKNSSRAVLV
jgi:hypothetical protein